MTRARTGPALPYLSDQGAAGAAQIETLSTGTDAVRSLLLFPSRCKSQHWPWLRVGCLQIASVTAFLKDGRLEIDNNRSERAIKPFVIGRKI